MLMLVPLVAFCGLKGGIAAITAAAHMRGISLALIPDWSASSIAAILLNPCAWCLGYFGMPHILTKFMGAADPHEMHKAKYVGIVWQLLATASAVGVGLVGIAYFGAGIPGKTEFIFIEMTKSLFDPLSAGLILCALLAATISTVDSQLLVLAGIVAEDFYKGLFNRNASPAQVYRVYNSALIGAACAGFLVAWNEQSSIMGLVRYAWAGLGASYGPLMLVSLYSQYPNRYGALAGMVIGALVAVVWDVVNPWCTDIKIYSIVPAYIASFAAIYGISWITKKQ
jgi:sodium/proline symporter